MNIADEKRLKELFLDLCRTDSLSFHERRIADRLKSELKALGFEVWEDEAGSFYGSECGNIYAFLKGNSGQEPVMFSSHMDTVRPGEGKQPQIDGDRITSDGRTVLGADNVCGIVEILEGVRIARANPAGHGDIEVLFTIAEEEYAKGAAVFDYGRIRSKDVYVLDLSGAPGEAARKAPSIVSFDLDITGRSSHAGFAPEKGINALQAAACAIAEIPQGCITQDTRLNIGTIEAGLAKNIVAGNCSLSGEVRSFNHEEAMDTVRTLENKFRQEADRIGAKTDFKTSVHIRAYETPEEAGVCRCFQAACKTLGLPGKLTETHGGSDNNVFASVGLSGIVLSCGMYQVHSTGEYTTLTDLAMGARLVAAIIEGRQDLTADRQLPVEA